MGVAHYDTSVLCRYVKTVRIAITNERDKMAIYFDSADCAQMRKYASTGVFSGVTSNPTILARQGLRQQDIPELYRTLQEFGFDRLFFQTAGCTESEIEESARQILSLGDDVVVKIPATLEGLSVAAKVSNEGYEVLLTAVYDSTQAAIAGELGVWGLAPYFCRMRDIGKDPELELKRMARILSETKIRILAASLRKVEDVSAAFAAGADDVTISLPVAETLVNNPLSIEALTTFERDGGRV